MRNESFGEHPAKRIKVVERREVKPLTKEPVREIVE